MDSVAGVIKKVWAIKAPERKRPRKDQTEADAEKEYQQALLKFNQEQERGITRKFCLLAVQDYKPDRDEPDRFDEVRAFTGKIHKDMVANVGDRVIVHGEKYELNGKLGFQADARIEVVVAAKK